MPKTKGYMFAGKERDAKQMRDIAKKWQQRINDFLMDQREKQWRKDAEYAEYAYTNGATDAQTGKKWRYNIFHANVETIGPSIFNTSPEPDIRARWPDEAAKMAEQEAEPPMMPEGMAEGLQMAQPPMPNKPENAQEDAAEILNRAIKFTTDDDALTGEGEMMVQDALVAGRGVLRVRFSADMEEEEDVDEAGNVLRNDAGEAQMSQRVVNEMIEYEAVPWRDFAMGKASRWTRVPWVAFKATLSKDELEDATDPLLKELYREDPNVAEEYNTTGAESQRTEEDKASGVWEIWDKATKKIIWLNVQSCEIINVADDVHNLKGFFPCTEPVCPIRVNGEMTPVNPFQIYIELAEELDTTSRRINAITKTLKVAGVFAGNAEAVIKVAEAEDGQLIPVADLEALAQQGGLDNAISWWPLDQAVAALQQLYQNRQETIAAIMQITGITDIQRGATDAREAAETQGIKARFASLRISKLQALVTRSMRDAFKIAAQMISAHFSSETLQEMTSMEVTDGVREILDSKLMARYRIDIETDSTIRADMTSKRSEMAAFLEGTANFFSAIAGVVSNFPQTAPMAAQIYSSFARNFNLGKAAEDALEQMSRSIQEEAEQPKQEQPSPEMIKAELEREKMQQQAQKDIAELQLEREKLMIEREKLQLDLQKFILDAQRAEKDGVIQDAEVAIKATKVEGDIALKQQEVELEREQERAVGIGN